MDLIITDFKDKKTLKSECIELTVVNQTKLGNFALTDQSFDSNGNISNVHRHFYKIPSEYQAFPGDKVYIYTGKGTDTWILADNKRIYKYYMGLDECIWNNEGDKANLWDVSLVSSMVVNED
ncbi:MAG: hypothetical protein ACO1PI_05415 [Bacteroidota bacterium]